MLTSVLQPQLDDKATSPFVNNQLPTKSNIVDTLFIDGSNQMTGDLDLNNNNIINLSDPPASNNDNYASNVKYVKDSIESNNTSLSDRLERALDFKLAETLLREYYTTKGTCIYRIDRALSSEVKIDANRKIETIYDQTLLVIMPIRLI